MIMEEYELKYNFLETGNSFGNEAPIITLIAIFALIFTLTQKKGNYKPKVIFLSIWVFLSILWTSYVFMNLNNTYKSIENKFKNGNYKTVIGEVINYKGDNPKIKADGESFFVDSVFFAYTPGNSIDAYHLPCSYGGFICGNGQKVKIDYIEVLDNKSLRQLTKDPLNNKLKHVNHIIKLSLLKNSK